MKTHVIKLSKELVPFISDAAQQIIGGSLGWSGTSTDDGEGEFTIHFEGEVDQTLIDNLLACAETLRQNYVDPTYKSLRQENYPPITDYLDAVVKGDDVAVQAYIDACLAVKAKYPKPE